MGRRLEIVGLKRSVGASMAFPSVSKSSSYLSVVIFGSRAFLALRWMMPGTFLEELAS
jgi:hypothetical protein